MNGDRIALSRLGVGQAGVIRQVGRGASLQAVRRLMEFGFLVGSEVEVISQAPFGGDPFSVRVRGGLVALRRAEADLIEIEIGKS